MIIAIDGPAAAGKGTLARRLAAHLGWAYLDTGALYRAVALTLIREGATPVTEDAAATVAARLDLSILKDPELRNDNTAELASEVARMPAVRANLLQVQRDFAARPPGGAKGAVIDGRDIGTVVCPDADVKIFVTADIEERARRRLEELSAKGKDATYEVVLADMRRRDARDRQRDVSPLRPSADAHLLDSSNLDIEAAFQRALAIVDAAGCT